MLENAGVTNLLLAIIYAVEHREGNKDSLNWTQLEKYGYQVGQTRSVQSPTRE